MNIVIIEDEELAARRLEGMILAFDPTVRVLAMLESVESAVDWFSRNSEPDLIFLDIHLEDGLSFAIFERIKISTPIIFTTAYDEYAIKAFKMRSIDYLLKPVIQEELDQAIRKYREWNKKPDAVVDLSVLYEIIGRTGRSYRCRFSIPVGQKIKTVGIEDVAYFHSTEGITFLVTRERIEYPLDLSLDKLTGELDPRQFFRINRQFMVSVKSIGNVHIYPKSRLKLELIPPCREEVFVSIDRVVPFKRWLDGEIEIC